MSYAGRLELLRSVIGGITNFWSSVFCLPKKVMKQVETLCRTFLWTGSTYASRKSLVAWQGVCLPKSYGGLNIRNLALWGQVCLAKHLWAISLKKDNLWIHWIHSFYVKKQLVATCRFL